MSAVYPEAPKPVEGGSAMDDQTIVDRIISNRQASPESSKEQLVGVVMDGCVNLCAFYRLWDEVEDERLEFAQVNPADFSTVTAFKAELVKHKKHLDETTWYDKLKMSVGATSFADLQDATKIEEA